MHGPRKRPHVRSLGAAAARARLWCASGAALWVALACSAPARDPSTATPPARPASGAGVPTEGGEPYTWQPLTRSPQPSDEPPSAVGRACPARDGALERAAAFIAARELRGKPALDAEDVTLVLRAEGAPYVWPRIWTLAGHAAGAQASERFAEWLAGLGDGSGRRCGVALASDASGREVVVGIALDVLAELDPLPTEVRIGAWVDVQARMLAPTGSVDVVVLGPRGQAQRVPSSLDGGRVRARFHADRPGAFLVQVLASVDGGPRPVAEAVVTAGETPHELFPSSPAPGEETPASGTPTHALFGMVNGARQTEGARLLTRDARLERVAQAHAEAMRAAERLAHDVGDGSPGDRVTAAGARARAVGENVAHAADVRHAHRTLWRSPSHRSNLLEPSYDAVGIGIAQDQDGTLWVCEVFATLAAP
ncbi:MAG TPA: CAP domain-containing protein [Polyangiaceae bacterium]|nr:CAP domain-containing protein [Polyangiaceae bacterium]